MSFDTFSTCDLCDQHKDDVDGAFRVLTGGWHDYGQRKQFTGLVTTVQCHEDNSRVKEAVESAGEGRVLVVDGAGSLRRALLGGNLGMAAAKNGWAGVVVFGAVRDLAELAQADVGIRALGHVPLPTSRRGQGQCDVPVCIQGTWVRPGDRLFADADGIVLMA